MNSRLTIQDLAALLAERTGKKRSSAEQFLKEFVAVVSQGVFTDKLVKVKGLGTFKVVLVDKRESVHVNTGERFIIPAHYKFSFLPDKELRELVNKPFSFFETTELNDEVDFKDLDISTAVDDKETEDESVEEILPPSEPQPEVEAEVEAEEVSPSTEEVIIELQPAEEIEAVEEMEETEETNDAESDVEVPELPELPEKEPEEEIKPENMQEPANKPTNEFLFEEEDPSPSPWIKIIVSVGLVALVAVIGVVLYQHRSFFLGSDKSTKALTGMSLPGTAVAPKDTIELTPDTVSADPPAIEPEAPAQVPEVLAKVKIEPGSRLTLISLEYYGSKIFWVYLYEYNKATIKDPNNVPVGTEILVPAPSLYGIDKKNGESVEKAAARQTEILSGK